MLPFGFWKSSVAVFNPATLALSGWWRANYTGAPWAATASAGVSGTTGNLVTAGSDPAIGTAQNLTPADFNGSANYLTNATGDSTLFSAAAGTMIALFRADTAAAPNGTIYGDPSIYHDAAVANTGLTYTTSGFTGYIFSGGYKSKSVAAATGSYHLVMMRWDGVNLGMTLNSAAETTQAAGNATLGSATMSVGKGYSGTFIDGRLLEFMTAKVTLTPTNYANIKSYVNSRYSLSL